MYKKTRRYWVINGKRTINGRTVRASDPGAVKGEEIDLGYFFQLDGKEISCGPNKEAAEAIKARLLLQKLESERGVPNFLVFHKLEIQKLIQEYLDNPVLGKIIDGKSDKHLRRAKKVFKEVMDANKWEKVKDLTSEGLIRFINKKLKNENPKDKSTRFGRKTANHWIGYWISFGIWLEKKKYVSKNPFSDIKKFTSDEVEEDRRLVRRRFTDDELLVLFNNTPLLKTRIMMSGVDRTMLYIVAALTGFRVSELGSLIPEDFLLDRPIPVIRLLGKNSKNRKTVEQIVFKRLVPELKKYLAGKLKGKPVWDLSKPSRKSKLAIVLRRDYADIKSKNPELAAGLFETNPLSQIDFHAFRVTFSTMLAEKIDFSAVQRLSRHGDYKTTDKIYVKLQKDFLQEELETALKGKFCHPFVTGHDRKPVELHVPRMDRVVRLVKRFAFSLSPDAGSVFMKKLGLNFNQDR